MKAIVVGNGTIGKPLVGRLKRTKGWQIRGVVSTKGFFGSDGERQGNPEVPAFSTFASAVDPETVVFLAIPTQSGGDTAKKYMDVALSMGAKVVTCEKGALSHHFDHFAPSLGRIGFKATVGGGTHLLPSLRERLAGRKDSTVHAVLNGTLNFLFHSMQYDGDSIGLAVQKAIKLEMAEPGANSELDVVNGEIRDTVMKSVIVYNTTMRDKISLKASEVERSIRLLEPRDLSRLIHEASVRRYIVSFLPPDCTNNLNMDVIGGFFVEAEGWRIRAGFQRTDSDPLFRSRLPTGANNCAIICEGAGGADGIYVSSNGPGAGPEPTTAAMMSDAHKFLTA